MHIRSFEIDNVRALTSLRWEIPDGMDLPGWHVVIGDNGAGKSTLLRTVALTILGRRNAEALRTDWNEWLSESAQKGGARLSVVGGNDDPTIDDLPNLEVLPFKPKFELVRRNHNSGDYVDAEFVTSGLWHDPAPGWFSAAFGPFRRFGDRDKGNDKLFDSRPRLARHLSVFGEDVALSGALSWLSQLRFEQLDGNHRSGQLLENIKEFINQEGFLPQGTRFESVDSKRVLFVDGNGTAVSVAMLGDGFKAILSLTFELLRQMKEAWPDKLLFTGLINGGTTVNRSGVVLIDEIDAHLHPTWQRQIGFWMTRHFPKVQFIVTTHSPLVCHAAENGTIFRLPTPGSGEEARMVTGLERERLVFGSVLDAYGTELFGADVSRSETAKQKQERLAELNQKALGAKLTANESKERSDLQALFPASM